MRFKDLVLLAENSDDDDILAGMTAYEELNKPVYFAEINHHGERYQDFIVGVEPIKKVLFDLYEADDGIYYKVINRFSQWIPPTKQEALERLNQGLPLQFDVLNMISIYCCDLNLFVKLGKNAINELIGEELAISETENFEQEALKLKTNKY